MGTKMKKVNNQLVLLMYKVIVKQFLSASGISRGTICDTL